MQNDSQAAVQVIMLIFSGLMGLSHVLRPEIWTRFFQQLARQGTSGVIVHSLITCSAVLIIVPFHQVWWGPGLVVTLWGWAMLAKVSVGLLFPAAAVGSLQMSDHGDRGFRAAGLVMLTVAASAGLALVWPD